MVAVRAILALSLLAFTDGCFDGNCYASCPGGIRIRLHGLLAPGDLVTPVRVCLNERCAVVLAYEWGLGRYLTEEIQLDGASLGGSVRAMDWTFDVAPKGASSGTFRDGDVVTIEIFEPSVTEPDDATSLGEPVKTLRWVATYEQREMCGDECLGVDLEGDLQGHGSGVEANARTK